MKYLDYTGITRLIENIKSLVATKFDKSGGTISGAVSVSGNINANYVTGTWLQGTASNHSTSKLTKVCMQDGNGWVYHRTLDELKSDMSLGSPSITENRYAYTTTSKETVSFTVPTYTTGCTLDVYINGMMCIPNEDYTLSGNVVTLVNELEANQKVYFVVRSVSS